MSAYRITVEKEDKKAKETARKKALDEKREYARTFRANEIANATKEVVKIAKDLTPQQEKMVNGLLEGMTPKQIAAVKKEALDMKIKTKEVELAGINDFLDTMSESEGKVLREMLAKKLTEQGLLDMAIRRAKK
jgi:FixJ family two-component response regulator